MDRPSRCKKQDIESLERQKTGSRDAPMTSDKTRRVDDRIYTAYNSGGTSEPLQSHGPLSIRSTVENDAIEENVGRMSSYTYSLAQNQGDKHRKGSCQHIWRSLRHAIKHVSLVEILIQGLTNSM